MWCGKRMRKILSSYKMDPVELGIPATASTDLIPGERYRMVPNFPAMGTFEGTFWHYGPNASGVPMVWFRNTLWEQNAGSGILTSMASVQNPDAIWSRVAGDRYFRYYPLSRFTAKERAELNQRARLRTIRQTRRAIAPWSVPEETYRMNGERHVPVLKNRWLPPELAQKIASMVPKERRRKQTCRRRSAR